MPRYFFHTHADTDDTDVEGVELDGPVKARHQAIQMCGEMMRDAPESFWSTRPWRVVVTNGSDRILWELSMNGDSAGSTSSETYQPPLPEPSDYTCPPATSGHARYE